METPPPAADISTELYYQLVYTLTDLLPPPLDETPTAQHARNHAAIAKVAALLPVGANELDLAAQCIAARGQAEEMLRLIRVNAGDIELVMRLNAQYGSMVRTSLSVHGRLMRVQALRQKQEATEGAAAQNGWTQHVVERSMLKVADPGAKPQEAARPGGTPAEAAYIEKTIDENVSTGGTNSHDAALETWVSEQPRNQQARKSSETGLRKAKAGSFLAELRLRGQDLPTRLCRPGEFRDDDKLDAQEEAA